MMRVDPLCVESEPVTNSLVAGCRFFAEMDDVVQIDENTKIVWSATERIGPLRYQSDHTP